MPRGRLPISSDAMSVPAGSLSTFDGIRRPWAWKPKGEPSRCNLRWTSCTACTASGRHRPYKRTPHHQDRVPRVPPVWHSPCIPDSTSLPLTPTPSPPTWHRAPITPTYVALPPGPRPPGRSPQAEWAWSADVRGVIRPCASGVASRRPRPCPPVHGKRRALSGSAPVGACMAP